MYIPQSVGFVSLIHCFISIPRGVRTKEEALASDILLA